jgi:hypothetical protein
MRSICISSGAIEIVGNVEMQGSKFLSSWKVDRYGDQVIMLTNHGFSASQLSLLLDRQGISVFI